MISRRQIVSNSCSNLDTNVYEEEQDEDVWEDKETLFRDHIQEIVCKYEQLDDEIWGKIICMERNHRVAKAYARYPIITINDGSVGFDGDTIGLCGFDNPYTDSGILSVKKQMIGTGIATAVDSDGNIITELLEPRNVYVKEWHKSLFEPRSSCLPEEIIIRRGKLTYKHLNVIFDMKKFLKNLNAELREPNPNQEKLEQQCITVISFGRSSPTDLLDTPVWIMIINMIALEMVHTNLRMISKKNCSIGSDSVKSDSDDYNAWSTPFNHPSRHHDKIGPSVVGSSSNGKNHHFQEWTTGGTTTCRRKYVTNGMGTGTIATNATPSAATTGPTSSAARRSQTMKVSKLMNGNTLRPPAPPPCHSSSAKQRPNSFHDSLLFESSSSSTTRSPPSFNPSSSSTHHLNEQLGHNNKTQTLNTRRLRGSSVTNYSNPSKLFRNSSVCNLERDIHIPRGDMGVGSRGGGGMMKHTKSGTVLLENRKMGKSTTTLWDDSNYISSRKGGKYDVTTSKKNGMINVSNSNRRLHQSLHHIPSMSTSSSASSASPPPRTAMMMKRNSSTLCHRLPPPDYSDSAIDVNNDCDDDDEIDEETEREESDDKFETYKSAAVEIEESNPIKSTGGFLNSVLRHLPLQTKTLGRKSRLQPKRPGSSYAPSSQDDSDGYTHIYSSINDSKDGKDQGKEVVGKKLSRTTTIPRTLRFWKSSSS